MTPLVSQLWPQFMADPDFAACFGRVVVEHAQMLRQERQVVFTLRSAAPLDKGLCARLLASLAPDYEGFELRINNLFGYATLDEAGLRELMEEMKRDGVPINGFLDRCRITITGQNITAPTMSARTASTRPRVPVLAACASCAPKPLPSGVAVSVCTSSRST